MTKEAMAPCEACIDLDELESEYLRDAHEGGNKECGECNAEYYQTYDGEQYALNEKAKQNHPELPTL